MHKLDRMYLAILKSGLVAIRNASYKGRVEYIRAEAEHLHDIPSLIGESNIQRHLYYFNQLRQTYLKWVADHGGEHESELITFFYAGQWKQMELILQTEKPDPPLSTEQAP